MRVNRIPTALRKVRMGELLAKHSEPQRPRQPRSPYVARPPPVPAKDGASPRPVPRKPVSIGSPRRGHKRLRYACDGFLGHINQLYACANGRYSDEITGAEDKENSVEPTGNPKKRVRAGPAAAGATQPQSGQVLSPTSTNARVVPRGVTRPASPVKATIELPASPVKSMIARPVSPTKGLATKSSSNILSSMVEKARATRGAAASRKVTASSTASSSAAGTSSRTKKPAVPAAAATRGRRKISQTTSESSESSTATVVKKATASRAAATKPAPVAKRTMMSTIKSATTKKAPAAKAAAPATTGRTLRKRQP